MLLEIAVGDAYGMGYEYVDRKVVEEFNKGFSYRQHPLHHELKPGDYTDDTQMSLALAEYFCQYGFEKEITKTTERRIANWFVGAFKRNPIKGYSRGFQILLEGVVDGRDMIEKITANGKTDKNGAAMRSVPCGLIKDLGFLMEFTALQAGITHEGSGVVASQAVALATWYFRNAFGKPQHLPEFLNSTLGINETWEWQGPVKSPQNLGMITAKAAIFAVLCTNSVQDAIIQSIEYSGDVDTVAAIAAGIASQSIWHEKNLTSDHPLVCSMRNNEFGKDYLVSLDSDLEKIAKKSH